MFTQGWKQQIVGRYRLLWQFEKRKIYILKLHHEQKMQDPLACVHEPLAVYGIEIFVKLLKSQSYTN